MNSGPIRPQVDRVPGPVRGAVTLEEIANTFRRGRRWRGYGTDTADTGPVGLVEISAHVRAQSAWFELPRAYGAVISVARTLPAPRSRPRGTTARLLPSRFRHFLRHRGPCFRGMRTSRRPSWGFESTLAAIAALPDDQKIDALLQVLKTAVDELPAETLRQKRASFMEHFSRCGGSFEVCSAVQELVDLHLKHQARRESETPAAENRLKPRRRRRPRSDS